MAQGQSDRKNYLRKLLKRADRLCPGPGDKVPCGQMCTVGQVRCAPCQAAYLRFRKYGVTEKQYITKLSEQKNACAICSTTDRGAYERFHIDHDHITKRFRGLLCINCNLGLGHFKDDPATLQKAVAYLTNADTEESLCGNQ